MPSKIYLKSEKTGAKSIAISPMIPRSARAEDFAL